MAVQDSIKIRDEISNSIMNHDYAEGPLLLLAGPGTGKTYSLIRTIKTQIKGQFKHSDFFEATLTNASADDFIKNAREQITPGFDSSSTLHHRAKGILHQHAGLLNLHPGFTVIDRNYKEIILEDICYILNKCDDDINEELKRYQEACAKYSPVESEFSNIYQKIQAFYAAIDWFDIVKHACELLETYKEVPEIECEKFKFLLVDEYQDLNPAEQKFVELLLNKRTRLLAVGDDDQSIYYSLRYADSIGITAFRDRYPNAQKIVLPVTTRLPSKVIDASYSLISKNNARDLSRRNKMIALDKTDERADGGFVISVNLKSGKAEREFICMAVNGLINGKPKVPPNDILVLCNCQALGMELIESIQNSEYKIPIHNGLKGTEENDENNLLLKYICSFISNQEDNLSLRMILSKLLQVNHVSFLIKHSLMQRLNLWETIETQEVTNRLESTGIIIEEFVRVVKKALEYDSRKEQLNYVLSEISPLNYLLDFVEAQDKCSNDITGESEDTQENEGIRFLTLHKSKGLDADYVFIPFMEESVDLCAVDVEEKRRLLYVAITRAKVGVVFSWAWSRHSNKRYKCAGSGGPQKKREASPYIQECGIDPSLGYANKSPSPSEKAFSIILQHATCVHSFDKNE